MVLLRLAVLPVLALTRSAREGVYTNLSGGDESPELSGAEFLGRWNGKTAGSLFKLACQPMTPSL